MFNRGLPEVAVAHAMDTTLRADTGAKGLHFSRPAVPSGAPAVRSDPS